MNPSRLDHLPVEIFHYVFSFFSAHEIFYTFTHLTSYIDSVINAYPNYHVNFKAITRADFDLVYQHLIPDRAITLIFADDKDTPGLIDLFLTRFEIHQFTRLRGLKLIGIGPEHWTTVITQMNTLTQLRSFYYDLPIRRRSWFSDLSPAEVEELDRSLFNIYVPILPQLYQLRLNHSNFLNTISFPHLHRLVLERSTIDQIKYIASVSPQLQMLETHFVFYASFTELIPSMPQLNQLILRVSNDAVSMNVFEQMMSNLPRLKHLQLISPVFNDVVDGRRWKTISRNLLTFKFSFRTHYFVESYQIDSFRTPFWIQVKRWFVACTDMQFFSVSQPITTELDPRFPIPRYTTVHDVNIFHQCTNQLELQRTSKYLNSYFPNVETLILRDHSPLRWIKTVIDLTPIRNLTLCSLPNNYVFGSLINEMPNLRQISIEQDDRTFLKEVRNQVLERIRTLKASELVIQVNDEKIGNVFSIFPYLEHFHVNSVCSIEEISQCLREFKHLSTASFSCIRWGSVENEKQSRMKIQSSLDQMRCGEGLDFTYRFEFLQVFFWIKSKENHHLGVK